MSEMKQEEKVTVANAANIQNSDEALLATMGYKQEFRREFTAFECFGVAFSIIGLLPSIGSTLVYSIPGGGGPGLTWGWLVASLGIMTVGLAMADIASAFPTSGGLYWWTYKFAPEGWKEVLSFVVGYANTLGGVSGLASINYAAAQMILSAVAITKDGDFVITAGATYGIYIAILVVDVLVCWGGTRVLARLQNVFIISNILLCVALFIALPAATPAEFKNTSAFVWSDFTNLTTWPAGFSFILAWLSPVWTICSFDSAVHISEESSNASKSVPMAITMAVAVAGVLGFFCCIVLAYYMGDVNAVLGSNFGNPMATIFYNSLGKGGSLGLWIPTIIIQIMMGVSIQLASSRQIFAFSRDNGLPGSHVIRKVSPGSKNPLNSAIFSAFMAALLGLLGFASPAAISAIFALSVTGLYFAYSLPIFLRVLARKTFVPGPWYLGKWSVPMAIASLIWMSFINIVFLFPIGGPNPEAVSMNYAVVVMVAVIGGALVYYYMPIVGARTFFTGPVRTLDDSSPSDLSENGSLNSGKGGQKV